MTLPIQTCGTCKRPMGVCVCAKTGAGAKNDYNKARWDLLPFNEVGEIVKILTIGAEKYSDNNWKKVPNGRKRYIAALLRHLVAWLGGERNDKETGVTHLAHAGCCLLFLMWIDKEKK